MQLAKHGLSSTLIQIYTLILKIVEQESRTENNVNCHKYEGDKLIHKTTKYEETCEPPTARVH